VSMDRMRAEPVLSDMFVLRRGMRLSVQPVTAVEYARVVELGHTPEEPRPVNRPVPRRPNKKRAPAKPVKAGKAAGAKARKGPKQR
jgi:hypothetical protein